MLVTWPGLKNILFPFTMVSFPGFLIEIVEIVQCKSVVVSPKTFLAHQVTKLFNSASCLRTASRAARPLQKTRRLSAYNAFVKHVLLLESASLRFLIFVLKV